MEKELLRFYANHPLRILQCPLEVDDFLLLPVVYKKLREHITQHQVFDSTLFGLECTSEWLELELSQYSPPFSKDYERALCEKLRKLRLEKELKLIKVEEPELALQKIDELRKPLEVEQNRSIKHSINRYNEEFADMVVRREATGSVGLQVNYKIFEENPLIPNTLLVVGARTSIGKSAFALNLSVENVKSGGRVLYMSAEMGESSILSRVYSLLTNVPVSTFTRALEVNCVPMAYDELNKLTGDMDVVYCGGWEWNKIKQYILSQENSYDMIVLDHLHYLPVPDKNEVQFLTGVVNDCKMISGKLKNVFVLLAQVNRSVGKDNEIPNVYNLKGSGGIEQGADMVLMLHRETKESPEVLAMLNKNRMGEIGNYPMIINSKTLKFI